VGGGIEDVCTNARDDVVLASRFVVLVLASIALHTSMLMCSGTNALLYIETYHE
jgi:hypothetical protein